MKVSILILTFNEAANLPACLAALSWCDDILVIDSGSTDDSVEIAKAHGCRLLHRPFDDFAGQRNYALEHGDFRHEWILHLDADEIVTPAFLAALEALQPTDHLDAWRVPFKTIFFGQWLRHAGMWPAYQVRLGHAQRLRFVQVGHGQREDLPPERVGDFPEALLHYSFSHGLRRWLDKHVRYAADEAAVIVAARAEGAKETAKLSSSDPTERRRAAKALAGRLPLFLRPVARFVYIYFVRRGFLDGRAGFVYAFMLSVYEAMMAILAYEQSQPPGANRIQPPKAKP
ncbi:glycosyltransferase [Caulobacter sp. SLTY]|uniref:glycosyltransferase family 2 protein n=1 Tax=Caulobacter sp. SLTY TaxID=2683262 RepID=UPI0014121E65|nr:glycosyltransferase family 2 protein [Caulobacter sp. SLTY]NBB16029.1 glycosyltransferase [Caulobacter sp. SLTY]